jgi:hypothetical protein
VLLVLLLVLLSVLLLFVLFLLLLLLLLLLSWCFWREENRRGATMAPSTTGSLIVDNSKTFRVQATNQLSNLTLF